MTDDRRRFARIVFDAPAWIDAGGVRQMVTVIDLSFKGALVKTAAPAALALGESCELSLTLDADGAGICMATTVKHVDGDHLGLDCVDLDLDSMTHLRRLIALNLGDPALLDRDLKALIAPR